MKYSNLDLVQEYKYLGILLDAHLKYDLCDSMLSKSAGRALSSLISKHKVHNHFNFDIYITMYRIHESYHGSYIYENEACDYNEFKNVNKFNHTC